jgi:hypothetical protein
MGAAEVPASAGSTARRPAGAVRPVAFDPAARVQARRPQAHAPGVQVTTRRKQRLTTAADPCAGRNREAVAPSRGGPWLVKPRQGRRGAPTSAADG